jgi:PKD repeat protein
MTTTFAAIRDSHVSQIEALVPLVLEGTKFRLHQGESQFADWCQEFPTACFRRFELVDEFDDELVGTTNSDTEEVAHTAQLLIAYPQHWAKYGDKGSMSLDDVIASDRGQLNYAIGIHGGAHYPSGLHISDLGSGSVSRLEGAWIHQIPIRLQYYRGAPTILPVASFTFVASGRIVDFTDTSTDSDGTVTEWDWVFGDGYKSTLQNPSHTYGADGTYTVTLRVTDNQGRVSAATLAEVTVAAGAGVPVFTLLAEDSSSTNGTSVQTASISPSSATDVYAIVAVRASVTTTQPTLTGCGLTWAAVDSVSFLGSGVARLTVFRARGTATPGQLTFTFGQTIDSFIWSVFEVSVVNGDVQTKNVQNAGSFTSETVALDSAPDAGNPVIVATMISTFGAIGHDADFSEISDRSEAGNDQTLEVQWAFGEQSCTATFSASVVRMIAVEAAVP